MPGASGGQKSGSEAFSPILEHMKQIQRNLIPKFASHEGVRNFLYQAIRHNDVAKLNEALRNGCVDLMRTAVFDHEDGGFNGHKYTYRGLGSVHLALRTRSLDTLRVLLEVGCDPDQKSTDGVTPVQVCAENGPPDALTILLQHGVSTGVQTRDGETLWHIAARMGQPEILRVLIDEPGISTEAALEQQSQTYRTPVCSALKAQQLGSVLALLAHQRRLG